MAPLIEYNNGNVTKIVVHPLIETIILKDSDRTSIHFQGINTNEGLKLEKQLQGYASDGGGITSVCSLPEEEDITVVDSGNPEKIVIKSGRVVSFDPPLQHKVD